MYLSPQEEKNDQIYRLTELYKALNHDDRTISKELRDLVVKKLTELVSS